MPLDRPIPLRSSRTYRRRRTGGSGGNAALVVLALGLANYTLVKVVGERKREVTDSGQRETLLRQIRFRIREAELERLYDQWLDELRDAAFIELK